jgi:hypothetical protein
MAFDTPTTLPPDIGSSDRLEVEFAVPFARGQRATVHRAQISVQRLRKRYSVDLHRAMPTFLRWITFGSGHSAGSLAHELVRNSVNFHRRLTKFHRSTGVAVLILHKIKVGDSCGNCNIFE